MKMAIQTWVIVALLVISYCQYNDPVKTNEMLKPIWEPVKNFIGKNNPISSSTSNAEAESTVCPDIDSPVCANGVTYKNSCEAALQGIVDITPGAC